MISLPGHDWYRTLHYEHVRSHPGEQSFVRLHGRGRFGAGHLKVERDQSLSHGDIDMPAIRSLGLHHCPWLTGSVDDARTDTTQPDFRLASLFLISGSLAAGLCPNRMLKKISGKASCLSPTI
jgi:hypothetical protein